MLSGAFAEPIKEIPQEDMEEITSFDEVVLYLQSLAETFVYLDDYPILVTEACTEPFIVMSVQEFHNLQRKVIGK